MCDKIQYQSEQLARVILPNEALSFPASNLVAYETEVGPRIAAVVVAVAGGGGDIRYEWQGVDLPLSWLLR